MRKRLKSFVHAWRGIQALFTTEPNAYIHALATVIVVGLGLWLRLQTWEWVAIILAIVVVFAAELLNTAIEKLCDVVHPDYSEKIKVIKDLAAGAVLVCAVGAVVIGLFIFTNHLL